MKVSELIEKLSALDPDLPVCMGHEIQGEGVPDPVGEVGIVPVVVQTLEGIVCFAWPDESNKDSERVQGVILHPAFTHERASDIWRDRTRKEAWAAASAHSFDVDALLNSVEDTPLEEGPPPHRNA